MESSEFPLLKKILHYYLSLMIYSTALPQLEVIESHHLLVCFASQEETENNNNLMPEST